jgi:hypothetical protein
MTYMDYVETQIRRYGFGIPIYTNKLAENTATEFHPSDKDASAAVSVAIKRIMDNKNVPELRFFQKGIYYRTKATPFGETGINFETLIADKYLVEDNGYETGYALLYRMGLTTQIPADRVIATNRAKDCIRKDKTLGVFIRPPKIKINAKNRHYLQTLDAIELVDKAPIDAERPYALIADHIQNNKLKYVKLLSLAGKHYNQNTVLTLARIAGARSWQ